MKLSTIISMLLCLAVPSIASCPTECTSNGLSCTLCRTSLGLCVPPTLDWRGLFSCPSSSTDCSECGPPPASACSVLGTCFTPPTAAGPSSGPAPPPNLWVRRLAAGCANPQPLFGPSDHAYTLEDAQNECYSLDACKAVVNSDCDNYLYSGSTWSYCTEDSQHAPGAPSCTFTKPTDLVCMDVNVGPNSQSNNQKTVTVPGLSGLYKCPTFATKENWSSSGTYDDIYEITQKGDQVTATRYGGTGTGWGVDLGFKCCGPNLLDTGSNIWDLNTVIFDKTEGAQSFSHKINSSCGCSVSNKFAYETTPAVFGYNPNGYAPGASTPSGNYHDGNTEPVGCVGGCGGAGFEAHEFMSTVETLKVWLGADYNGFQRMEVTFFNGAQSIMGGSASGSPDAQYTFGLGETLLGQIEVAGNGATSSTSMQGMWRVGYLKFTTSKSCTAAQNWNGSCNVFEVGSLPDSTVYNAPTLYKFNSNNAFLSGFHGNHGSAIDNLGFYLFGVITDIEIATVEYPGLKGVSSTGQNEGPGTVYYCNDSGQDEAGSETFTYTNGDSTDFSIANDFGFLYKNIQTTITAGIPVPDESTTTSAGLAGSWQWATSAITSRSTDIGGWPAKAWVTEDLATQTFNGAYTKQANTKGTTTWDQYKIEASTEWKGVMYVNFAKGGGNTLTIAVDAGGHFNGTQYSAISMNQQASNCGTYPNPACECPGTGGMFGFGSFLAFPPAAAMGQGSGSGSGAASPAPSTPSPTAPTARPTAAPSQTAPTAMPTAAPVAPSTLSPTPRPTLSGHPLPSLCLGLGRKRCLDDAACEWIKINANKSIGKYYNPSNKLMKKCVDLDCSLFTRRTRCQKSYGCVWDASIRTCKAGRKPCSSYNNRRKCGRGGCSWNKRSKTCTASSA